MPVPGRNLYILLVAGIVPWVLELFFPRTGFLFPIFMMVAVLLVFVDFFLIPAKKTFQIRRDLPEKLSIGAENPVSIIVENSSSRGCVVEIRDHIPTMMTTFDDTVRDTVRGFSSLEFPYHIIPTRKGHYVFDGMDVRVLGPLSLVWRQYRYKIGSSSEVYPNLFELNKFIRLYATSRLDQAGYRQKSFGTGTEFSHLREYRVGDEYRKIDWKATSRRRIPVTRIHKKEDSRNIIVVLDAGRMMTTRYGVLTKLDLAIDAALILAAAAGRKKDNFGLLVYAEKIIRFLPPASAGNLPLGRVISILHDIEPSFRTSNHSFLTQVLGDRIRKNSIVFLFSEFVDKTTSAGLEKAVGTLQRHSLHLVNFEEYEGGDVSGSLKTVIREAIQVEEIVDREIRLRTLGRSGVKSIRVNEQNIRQQVVNAYLGM